MRTHDLTKTIINAYFLEVYFSDLAYLARLMYIPSFCELVIMDQVMVMQMFLIYQKIHFR